MKYAGRSLCILMVLVFVCAVGFGVFCVYSRTTVNGYTAKLKIALNAAALSNGLYVVAADGEHELNDESYRKLFYYLTRSPVAHIGFASEEKARLVLRVGEDTLYVVPYDGDDERAAVLFATDGMQFRIQISDDALWDGLSLYAGEAYYYDAASDEGAA